MPSDIIATKGAATANCYATLDEAEAYFDDAYGADEWASLDEDSQARLLLTATKQIERMPIAYEKAATAQALKFPVANTDEATDDGFVNAREACLAQAFYLLRNNDAIQEAINASIQGVKAEGLSSVSKTITGYNPFRKWSPEALRALGAYLDWEFKTYRG